MVALLKKQTPEKEGLTVNEALRHATRRLYESDIATAKLDARLILQHIVNCDYTTIIVRHFDRLTEDQQYTYDQAITRRMKREPVSHIIGMREFWSLDFTVSRHVLDPRPDSETLIETAVAIYPDRQQPLNILDLGTGSGCLLLSLLMEYPNSTGVAVDISKDALQMAKKNAVQLGLSKRVDFIQGNWIEPLQTTFDLVVCNPPYIAQKDVWQLEPEVRVYEPHLALVGGEDGLDCYRLIAKQLPHVLHEKSNALFEIGQGQAASVADIFQSQGLTVSGFFEDLTAIPRCIAIKRSLTNKERAHDA